MIANILGKLIYDLMTVLAVLDLMKRFIHYIFSSSFLSVFLSFIRYSLLLYSIYLYLFDTKHRKFINQEVGP